MEWRPIPGYTNYEITKSGEIRNIKTGQVLKQLPNQTGYPRVTLRGLFDEIRRPVLVAQLVMHTFAPEVKPRRYIVRYKDGNRKNVSFDNLFYSTRSEMFKGFWKVGIYKRPVYKFPSGPLNPRWRIGARDVSTGL